jgi:hypothetical protein
MKSLKTITKNSHLAIHLLSVLLFFCLLYTLLFSTVIFSGQLLGPGDGFTQNLPNFYSPLTLWTNLLFAGFPAAADPQVATWYPISPILHIIPNSWNSFVICAYVLASCFSYGYVYTITRSKLAAFVGGITYGMSGFMMAHLDHTNMIHTASWMPLSIWALEKLRHRASPLWLIVGVGAIAFSILAGHPQIAVYSFGLSAVYALTLGWNAPIGRGKYYRLSFAVVGLGVGLAAIQIIPTMELSALGLRSEMTFEEFNAYSLPPVEAVKLLFPYFFGGSPLWLYDIPYHFGSFGSSGLRETTGYVGLLPLMLAVIGLLSRKSIGIARFWLCVTLVAFLLTLGYATPLSSLVYHVPLYNKFRVPARHFIEMALAVSALSGIGVAAIQEQLVSKRLLMRTVLGSISLITLVLIGIFFSSNAIFSRIEEVASQTQANQFTLLPWYNPALGIPLLVFLIAATVLIVWFQSPKSQLLKSFLLLILVIDLGSFGWFYEWQYSAPYKDQLIPTISTSHYKKILIDERQRMLSTRGSLATLKQIPSNLSQLWNVPNAGGYNPLILKRISELLQIEASGIVPGKEWANIDNHSLDILATKYVFMPKLPPTLTGDRGFRWCQEDMAISLGSGCGNPHPNRVKLRVPERVTANAIGIVSSLGCSTGVHDNAKVVNVSVTDVNQKTANQSLQAGRDTSEWAYDCSDVRPHMQHQRATIFESFPTRRDESTKCQGHKYVSILPLNKLDDVKSVELEYVGSSGADIGIQKVSLINNETKQSYPVTEISSLLANTSRWHHVEDIDQTSVYENLRAMPQTWLVPEVVSAKPDEVLRAIKSSQLPDGRFYDPSQVALIEEPLNLNAQNFDPDATAKIIRKTNTSMEIQTSSNSPAFLILSDVDYPGWQANIDREPTHIFKTNYAMRGVAVPEGNHVVRFEFEPLSFHLGVGISLASLFLLGYLSFSLRNKYKFATYN